jgi:hypothetical protein
MDRGFYLADDPAALETVAQYLHPITQQSGRDATPEDVDGGTFKGNTGAIGGTIVDQTGAVIPGATITIRTGAGGTVATAKSLTNGIYVVPNLEAGLYTVEVAAPGFMSFVVTEVDVSPVALTTVDVELRVGAVSEMVTVSAPPVTLDTVSASVSVVATGFVGTAKGGKAVISEPAFTPRLRRIFEETAYWAPSLETGLNGRAKLHVTLPDSLTTWTLHALASTIDGRVGAIDETFRTFQPFFVDLDVPQVLTVGDEISLPVNLRNYCRRGRRRRRGEDRACSS